MYNIFTNIGLTQSKILNLNIEKFELNNAYVCRVFEKKTLDYDDNISSIYETLTLVYYNFIFLIIIKNNLLQNL